MPVQAFQFEVKQITDTGSFSGLASTYGNTDLAGESVMPGAFARTLAEAGKQRPLLYQHREPIGLVTLRDTPAGLEATGQLSMGVQLARDAYALLKDGVVKGMSIGYQTVRDQVSGGVRQLLELKLYEISLVTFPMNEMATVTAVKSSKQTADEILRAARDLRDFRQSIEIIHRGKLNG